LIVNIFSKNIKICSYFDLSKTFLRYYEVKTENYDEIFYVKLYNGETKSDEFRKVVYVNKNDNPYQALIYTLRNVYALDYKEKLLLHASTISIDNENAILFVGQPSSGKTTILRKCLERGFYYISEDMLFIDFDFCYFSPPFKVFEIEKITFKAKIKEIYFINFKYGSKFIKISLNDEEKKKLIFESLFNTKALFNNFQTFKKLIEIPSYYVMYSNCEDLIKTF